MYRFAAALVLLAASSLPNGAQPLQSATQYTFLVPSNGNEGDTDVSNGACIAAVEQANTMPGTAVAAPQAFAVVHASTHPRSTLSR